MAYPRSVRHTYGDQPKREPSRRVFQGHSRSSKVIQFGDFRRKKNRKYFPIPCTEGIRRRCLSSKFCNWVPWPYQIVKNFDDAFVQRQHHNLTDRQTDRNTISISRDTDMR